MLADGTESAFGFPPPTVHFSLRRAAGCRGELRVVVFTHRTDVQAIIDHFNASGMAHHLR
jgi:hypothetical protein